MNFSQFFIIIILEEHNGFVSIFYIFYKLVHWLANLYGRYWVHLEVFFF
jgi:hypothetical protein